MINDRSAGAAAAPTPRAGRVLAAARPGAYNADVAISNNLAIDLSELGRLVEAAVVVVETVAILRHLVAAQPGTYDDHLAMTLGNLSIDLSALGRDGQAAAMAAEAAIQRRIHAAALERTA